MLRADVFMSAALLLWSAQVGVGRVMGRADYELVDTEVFRNANRGEPAL
jgi:hypothetical protein